MTVQDSTIVPALPDRARPMRWGYYAVRLFLLALLLAGAAALPSGHGAHDRLRYREGDIARERVVAPYDFRVEKDDASLRREQDLAAAAVAPVFNIDPKVSNDMLQRFALFQEKTLAIVSDPTLRTADRVPRIRTLGVPLSEDGAEALSTAPRARRVLGTLGGWLSEAYTTGIVAEKRGDRIQGF